MLLPKRPGRPFQGAKDLRADIQAPPQAKGGCDQTVYLYVV